MKLHITNFFQNNCHQHKIEQSEKLNVECVLSKQMITLLAYKIIKGHISVLN